MSVPDLDTWWRSGQGRNSYTVFRARNGQLSVYVRRSAFCPDVMEIANVSTISGWGGVRALYRDYCRDIPALAENILNPALDALLERLGWDWVYRDLGGIPTRINQAFQHRFPDFRDAPSAGAAMRLTKSHPPNSTAI